MPDNISVALKAAAQTRLRAYVPYSGFRVGAALIVKDHDVIFTGCNVENSSFGATVCAERSALLTAVSALGAIEVQAVVVVTDTPEPAVPCALCLQVLAEFCSSDTMIYLASPESVKKTYKFKDLLPHPFKFEAQ